MVKKAKARKRQASGSGKPKAPTKKQLLAMEIKQCKNKTGRITPAAVVAYAKAHPNSLLNKEFEWSTDKAAQMHWEDRARELINQVRFIIHYEDHKVIVPYYVTDPTADEHSYVETTRIAKQRAASREVIQKEIDRIKGAIHRAMSLATAFNMRDEFEGMLEDLVQLEKKFKGRYGSADVGAEIRPS